MSDLRRYQPRTLEDHGIYLKSLRIGNHRLPCPKCSKRSDDQVLSVTVCPDGHNIWQCFRCGFAGANRENGLPAFRRLSIALTENRFDPGNLEHMHPKLSSEGQELWASAKAIAPDTPAWRYLTEARGIDLERCDSLFHALRWLSDHQHPRGYRGPALVALLTEISTEEPISLHRTWLAQDGSGKAPIDTPRLLLKGHRKKGGVVRLSGSAGRQQGFAEGIETALSAIDKTVAAWATLDAGNLAAMPVLPEIESPWVFADNDEAGRKAARAFAERWTAAGREVRIYTPAQPGADLNDELRQGLLR